LHVHTCTPTPIHSHPSTHIHTHPDCDADAASGGVFGDLTVHSRVHTSASQGFGAEDLQYGAIGDRVGRATYDYDGVDELALDQPDEPSGFESSNAETSTTESHHTLPLATIQLSKL